MSNKLLTRWGTGCGLRAILSLLLPLVAFGILIACMLIVALLPLPHIRGWSDRDVRALILAGGLALAFFAALTFVTLFGVRLIVNRARALDAAFTPLGLAGGAYLLNGRQYHGTRLGRQVDAYFYRGPALDLYVSASIKTRLGIGTKESIGMAIAGMMNRQPLDIGDPEFGRLAIYPLDEAWARTLLADPQAKAALLRLADDASLFGLRSVNIQPGSISLRMRSIDWKKITAESARQRTDDLITLARAAESLPAPEQTAEESNLERTARLNRGSFSLRLMAITFAVFGFLFVCILAAVLIMIALTEK